MKNELSLPKILMCGYYDSQKFSTLKVSPKYVNTMFEIEYFLEDGGNMYSDGVAYPIRRNFVLICPPGQERYSELPFKTKYLKFTADGKLAELLINAPRYFHVSQSLEATALLDECITAYTVPNGDELLFYGRLLSYLSLLLDNAKHAPNADTDPSELTVQAQEFIKEHYREPIRLLDIARAVNLSPNYFHKLFRESCRCTPREYLEEYRINVAKKLLLTTQLSLCEIAEQCGFHNQQYLSTVFKSLVGCTPAQFKHRHQGTYLP